ncbi:hypothetical protein [Legionella wadsworthii]|nr:hypothetical protein [Legionella wadsworthii]
MDLLFLKLEIKDFDTFCKTIVNKYSAQKYSEHTLAYIVYSNIYYQTIIKMYPATTGECDIDEFKFLKPILDYDTIRLFQIVFLKSRNRSFCVESNACFEEDLKKYCRDKELIGEENEHKCKESKCCLKNIKTINVRYYADKIMKTRVDKETKQQWQNFFDAVSVVRNRGAHSNEVLSISDMSKLKKGRLETVIDNKNKVINIGIGCSAAHFTRIYGLH